MRIVVYHAGYGCDTGCCGHVIEKRDDAGHVTERGWSFSHPYGDDPLEFARELIRDEFGEAHIADLDWGECLISDYD